MEKVNFSKFFPDTQQFIVVKGHAKSPEDFDLTFSFGDGLNTSNLFLHPFGPKDNAGMLRAMRDSLQRALDFYESVLKLPSMPVAKDKPLEWIFSPVSAKKADTPKKSEVTKKAAPKKKPAAKK